MLAFRTSPRAQRIALFRSLATAQSSGLPLATAIQLLPDSASRRWKAEVESALRRGSSLVQALTAFPHLSIAQRAAIAAAERAGHLDECFVELADDEEALAREQRQLWMACAYPLIVLHLVVPAASTRFLITNPGRFFLRCVVATLLLWLAIALTIGLARRLMATAGGTAALSRLPPLGPVLRRGAHLRFLRSLRQLYAAGVPFPRAVIDARSTIGESRAAPDLDEVTSRAARQESMERVCEALAGLDPLLRAELVAAAHVGNLEPALRHVVTELHERQRIAVRRLAALAGTIVYVFAFLAVALTVVSFYVGYYHDIMQPIRGRH